MIVDVDLGNTRIKWRSSEQPQVMEAFAREGELPGGWRLLSGRDRMRLASVWSPEKTLEFVEVVREFSGVVPECAQVQQDFAGLHLAYSDVSRFGVDRWLALLAARVRFPARDCVVVSGGTALTVDLVTGAGLHLGGYIAPGRQSITRALWQSADGLVEARRDFGPRLLPGTTTLECVAAGTTLFLRGFAHELRQRLATQMAQPLWIFTGGDAEALVDLFAIADSDAHVVPELVLAGLAIALP